MFHVLCSVLMKKTNNGGGEGAKKQTGWGLSCLSLTGRFSWASLCCVFLNICPSPPPCFLLVSAAACCPHQRGSNSASSFFPNKTITGLKGWKSCAEGGVKAAYDSGQCHCHGFFSFLLFFIKHLVFCSGTYRQTSISTNVS